jgi:hypothetical protein
MQNVAVAVASYLLVQGEYIQPGPQEETGDGQQSAPAVTA